MARTDAVWGIDIGQCALKAIRCRRHPDRDDKIVADAFDYIEYPKILTQPGADPQELVADALKQFLSRNNVRGDYVSVSVAGQNGLARFIKLPPVESKKIPDIVHYEAKQQIPFALEDVKFEYQQIGVGSEEEGFALDTEIGLFAMKLDQLYRSLDPFEKAGIEVNLVQLTPLCLYNFLVFDQLQDLPPPDEYDPEEPPESIVILSLGTDTTDLVVTNGYRVWQRSIPLGGNHFTKALTKELKLTFGKAEHLKRNARQAQDPKAVFQAMRPVFNDLVTEVQRSVGYFTTLDRQAKISRIVALGNAMKLPGLRRFLAQNLGFEVMTVESFRGLGGAEVVNEPAFKKNVLAFGVSYGLAVQGLGYGKLKTNMLPDAIRTERFIREKKPWAVAAAALLLLACTISFASHSRSLSSVKLPGWNNAVTKANQVVKQKQDWQSAKDSALTEYNTVDAAGKNLMRPAEHRTKWLEMLKAVNECLRNESEIQLVLKNLSAYQGNKEVTWRGQYHSIHGENIWYIGNAETAETAEDLEYFVVQYPSPEQAEGYKSKSGKITGLVQEIKTIQIPSTDEQGQETTRPVPVPVLAFQNRFVELDDSRPDSSSRAEEIMERDQLHVDGIAVQPMEDLGQWWTMAQTVPPFDPNKPRQAQAPPSPAAAGGPVGAPAPGGPPATPAEGAEGAADTGDGLSGPGYVVQINGYHYHNLATGGRDIGPTYVYHKLVKRLENAVVQLPGRDKPVPVKELGFSHPVLLEAGRIWIEEIPDEDAVKPDEEAGGYQPGRRPGVSPYGGGEGYMMEGPVGPPPPGAGSKRPGTGETETPMLKLRRFDFTVQFAWQPVLPSQRTEQQPQEGEAAAADGSPQSPAAPATPTPPTI